jgi:xanthosine utilization system XapX-like protein
MIGFTAVCRPRSHHVPGGQLVPEGPVEAHEMFENPVAAPAAGQDGVMPVLGLRDTIPRVVFRADLLPAASALAVVALLGLPLGWVWSRLAPPQDRTLSAHGELGPVPVETYHGFDALAIFLLMSFAAGLLIGAALWMLRHRRGPVILLAGVLGSLVAAWLAIRMGGAFAAAEYPMPAAPKPGTVIEVAPRVSTLWAVVAQPLGVTLAYGLATSWNGMDDLGRRER